jgi:hypothetical protein
LKEDRTKERKAFNPLLRIKDLELEMASIKRQLEEVKNLLNLKNPSPEVSEIQNEIAYNKAIDQRIAGDRTAFKRFFAAGGWIPKTPPNIMLPKSNPESKSTRSGRK